jgi:hypothetical protein
MRLYVCWGTFGTAHGHPCAMAHQALLSAGHDPEVVRTGGCYRTDPLFPRRRRIKRLTGDYKVPTLELEDGTIVDGSQNIADWAKAHPAGG